MALNAMNGPMIIISASGMCEAGRILHHLRNNIEDPKNIVLIVGYMAENTLGRRIAERHRDVKIFGNFVSLRSKVVEIEALSAHADEAEMLEYFHSCGASNIRHAFCVPRRNRGAFTFFKEPAASRMQNVSVPTPGQCLICN
jgi:metallo-beta-lactamase family protein